METEWGTIPTIGIELLIELKKTQRLEDYPIISKLAVALTFRSAWKGKWERSCTGAFPNYKPRIGNIGATSLPNSNCYARRMV